MSTVRCEYSDGIVSANETRSIFPVTQSREAMRTLTYLSLYSRLVFVSWPSCACVAVGINGALRQTLTYERVNGSVGYLGGRGGIEG